MPVGNNVRLCNKPATTVLQRLLSLAAVYSGYRAPCVYVRGVYRPCTGPGR